jgi:hypothetical protein
MIELNKDLGTVHLDCREIRIYRVDTASLDTFLLRRNTRLAFSQNTRLTSKIAYRVDTASWGCIEISTRPSSKKSSYLYSMNWKEAIKTYFPDIWQYLVIILIILFAAIFIL